MKRGKQQQRDFAEQRWPLLSNLMACYFNEDFDLLYGSLDGAVAASAKDGSLDHRRAILKEWRDWNSSVGAATDLQPELKRCFPIAVRFRNPTDARHLMDGIHDRLIEGIRDETKRD
ncbi:contact-dependent growth inhibition system immunity protein [Sphingomonas bisphenolicum]|uniref:contact-dependent growth inhibition system immunity protein n=1 Tax=Sphingomonas bisphenolicum TaxID=296544 RepID=UPI0036F424BD